MESKNKKGAFRIMAALILIGFSILPFFIVILRSFSDDAGAFSGMAWYEVFLGSTRYLYRFWKSLLLCSVIMVGQMIVSVLAGYGFAKFEFWGRKILFFCLMLLMVLPLQVTLVPNYMVLDKMKLLDTYGALIFPCFFVPLGTFIMTQSFQSVPDEVLEAGRLDGCGEKDVLFRIALPMRKGSIVCVGILSFLDAWNMVEQPIAYLKDFEKYPIAVALASVSASEMNIQMVCSVLVLLPPLLLFLLGGRAFVKGIAVGEKA